MRNRITFAVIFIGALACLFQAGLNAADKPAGKVFFVCEDEKNPCAAEKKADCPECGKTLVEKPFELEKLMGTVDKFSKNMKTAVDKSDFATIVKYVKCIEYIYAQVPTFTPPKNADRIDDFKKFASELSAQAQALGDAASKNDAEATKAAFSKYGKICGQCHSQFRKVL
jgi:cytochrome c556